MNMALEYEIEAEVTAMGMDFDILDDAGDNPPVTMNRVGSTPQGSLLVDIPVRGINLDDVTKSGGPINYTVMGAFLAILCHEVVPQLVKTGNPNSRIQHALLTPATLKNCPTSQSKANKILRARLCQDLNLPSTNDLDEDTFLKTELQLRVLTPLRDTWTNPGDETFQWASMMIEIGKRPGEKHFGWRACYLHPAHEAADPASGKEMSIPVKKTMSKVKSIVKSNSSNTKTKFTYKAYQGGNDPVRLDTVVGADPNDSGIIAPLTIGLLIMQVNF